ncbi:hypothetical protein K501DRAFT_291765 [Backusella circina FSU 941]|nr:hypothetical protein K501DRAFT_291765 [Backusella circina FSU 941]
MFRPNPTVDLNEFPALGTPPSSSNNRLASYASFQPDAAGKTLNNARAGFNSMVASSASRSNAPRSFSMEEFPALKSSSTPFDNTMNRDAGGKPEQWLDYANLREGLLGVIRMTDPDRSMLALGSDLTTLGLDLNTPESIYSTFISPWSDTQTLPGLNVEPGYYLPACYRNVQASPPAHQRMRTFSDEILFYVFYCMPKDIAQEAAAQELYNRNWRYHKELGLWLTKETDENGRPVQVFSRRASPNGLDRGVYVFFDPTTWQKVKREWTLSWDAIEERNVSSASDTPVLSNGPTLQQQQQNRMQ